MVRVFPKGAMSIEVPSPVFAETAPPRPPLAARVRATVALVRKVAPGAVERIKRAVEPPPAGPAAAAAPVPQEWLASDIVWAAADDPSVDMDRAVGLAAICHKPRRNVPGRD